VITHVASGEEQEARPLPIARFFQVVKDSVDRSNTGDPARAYRKAVAA